LRRKGMILVNTETISGGEPEVIVYGTAVKIR
jgi:hypothetical protein